ncbi:MAG: hypothetical protein ACE5Q6_18560, partial [Dehalococcoidia bacterium]
AKLYGAKPFATVFCYVVLISVLATVFLLSIRQPMYEIHVDLPSESVIRVESHLLPPGRNRETIPFGKIDLLTIAPLGHSRFVVEANVVGDRRVEMGRGRHEEMTSLANTLSVNSGARLE